MLFKHLMAAASLAVSVMSSPTSTDVVAQGASLEKCQAAIVEVKQPVVESCSKGHVDEVKSHLDKVKKPVKTAAFYFQSTYTIHQEILVKYSYEFVKILQKFEEVLIVIHSHPQISAGCTDVFAQFNIHFDSICTEFEKHGVDIYKAIKKESSIHFSVWDCHINFEFKVLISSSLRKGL